MVKVLVVLVVLYVVAVALLATNVLQDGFETGDIAAEFGRSLGILLVLLGLGVVYAVVKPAFGKSQADIVKAGQNPDDVPTTIKFGQNPLAYGVQTVARAVVLLIVGLGLLGFSEAESPITLAGLIGGVGQASPMALLAVLLFSLGIAASWPYGASSSSSSGGHDGGGDDGE